MTERERTPGMEINNGFEYLVVINDEEQYSILRTYIDIPAGWRDGGFRGTEEECLAHIDEVWTDMRPLSLRKLHEQRGIKA
jgi:MbtH protein